MTKSVTNEQMWLKVTKLSQISPNDSVIWVLRFLSEVNFDKVTKMWLNCPKLAKINVLYMSWDFRQWQFWTKVTKLTQITGTEMFANGDLDENYSKWD